MSVMQGKVVAITGAASGIGRALAWDFARRGADLALSDVDEAGLEETASAIRDREVTTTRLDVSKRDDVERWAEQSIQVHGHVDAVINNAGVTVQDTLINLTYEDFEWIVGINFWGVVYGTKAFLPHFLERDTGWIVNISSVFGMIGFPTQSAYNATKFAVRGLTEALRWELEGTNVTACSVHPGGIRTNIVRNARLYRDMDGAKTDKAAAVAQFDKIAKTTPAQAAKVIIDGMEKREPRILIGLDAKLIDAVQRVAPRKYGPIMERIVQVLER